MRAVAELTVGRALVLGLVVCIGYGEYDTALVTAGLLGPRRQCKLAANS
jgi:hypothetical protein